MQRQLLLVPGGMRQLLRIFGVCSELDEVMVRISKEWRQVAAIFMVFCPAVFYRGWQDFVSIRPASDYTDKGVNVFVPDLVEPVSRPPNCYGSMLFDNHRTYGLLPYWGHPTLQIYH